MAIRDILLHLDHTPRCQARLSIAVEIARQHEAHLIGLYVVAQADVPDFIPGQSVQRETAAAQATAQQVAETFDEACRQVGVSAEWRQVDAPGLGLNDMAEQVILNSHYADLVVIGQYDGDSDDGSIPADLPDEVVTGAGRPVLVIPYIGNFDFTTVRALVAWNAGRESTRAVNDALPFLKRAKSVVVMAVNPTGDDESGHGEIPCADIATHLARHDVKVEAQYVNADDLEVGDILLSRAADQGINLLVCGAYQKSRLREQVLGGVTRQLLTAMTAPALMSH